MGPLEGYLKLIGESYLLRYRHESALPFKLNLMNDVFFQKTKNHFLPIVHRLLQLIVQYPSDSKLYFCRVENSN